MTYKGLPSGRRLFKLRVVYRSKKVIKKFSWTIEASPSAPPTVTLKNKPPDPSVASVSSFAWSTTGDQVATSCALDDNNFTSCSSPITYSSLHGGSHTFIVRASNSKGSSDASYTWNTWISGANVANLETDIYSAPSAAKSFRDHAGEGGNTLIIGAYWFSDSAASTTISPIGPYAMETTASDQSILDAMAAAKAAGLAVGIKSSFIVKDGTWSAVIHPSDPDAWFSSYTALVEHYADLAQQGHADFMVFATELDSLANTNLYEDKWRTLIADLRSRFSGKLLYAASRDGYSNVPFYDALDYISMEGYYPLTLSNNPHPTVAQLAAAWSSFMDSHGDMRHYVDEITAVHEKFNKPVVFTEIGYSSGSGMAADPGFVVPSINQQDQADAYEAFFEVWSQVPWFRGFFYWVLTARGYDSTDNTHDFRGKAAETTVMSWLGGSQAAPPNLAFSSDPNGDLDTFIDVGPVGPNIPSSGRLFFHSPRSGVTFECRLDVPAWSSCTSPYSFTGLSTGLHNFQVRAVDGASRDSSPAQRTFTVG